MENSFRGNLKKWNDKKGFGFIEIQDSSDVFIHISAFKNSLSRRPKNGDVIVFQKDEDNSGKIRAVNASIQGLKSISFHKRDLNRKNTHERNPMSKWIILLLVLIVAIFYYSKNVTTKNNSPQGSVVIEQESKTIEQEALSQIKYKCEGKIHCSQMKSCGEAQFYIRNCPNTKMDGDRDGIPCEKQWCDR